MMAYIRNLASHVFKTYPLISNSLIYGGLYMTAEFMQQTGIKKVLVRRKSLLDLQQITLEDD